LVGTTGVEGDTVLVGLSGGRNKTTKTIKLKGIFAELVEDIQGDRGVVFPSAVAQDLIERYNHGERETEKLI
jgi:hypothetical protein